MMTFPWNSLLLTATGPDYIFLFYIPMYYLPIPSLLPRSMLKFQLYDHTGPRATLFHHQTPRIGLVQNPPLGPQHLLAQGGGLPHLFSVPVPYYNAIA